MSSIGKILVVVQVALSVLFMAFAGAVYSSHLNWKTKHDTVQKQLSTVQQNLNTTQGELANAKREHETALAEASQKASEENAKNITLQAQLAESQAQARRLQLEQSTQTGLAESKAEEAGFRMTEAERQRIENTKLQATLDQTSAENRDIRDRMFTLEESYRQLNKNYTTGLQQIAFLKKVVGNAGLETDPEVVSKQMAPPPVVEGMVTQVRSDRTSRVKYVEFSLGSDDGLVKGNELDVVRLHGKESSEWLGKIKIVDLYPDSAVGEVILPSKNGIIKEGDNVTSQLGI